MSYKELNFKRAKTDPKIWIEILLQEEAELLGSNDLQRKTEELADTKKEILV